MSVNEKDPYLEELDSMTAFDEPTKVDLMPAKPIEEPMEEPLAVDQIVPPEPVLPKKERRSKKLVEEFTADVPLQVVAVLGSRELTLQQLASLQTGEVMELGCAPNQIIDLTVNSRTVARGELVEIEGKLGVRILKVI